MLAGLITNASNRSVNSGTLVISGDASGAGGTTTVNGGTLRLDYSTSDTSKLPESVLTLSGGTVELVGGTVAQAVLSTTLTAGKSTRITRPSGSARLDLRAVTSTGGGTVVLAQSGIATTDELNTNGILPWARVLVGGTPVLGTNSLDAFNGPIVPYAGFTNVNRVGPDFALPNGFDKNVQIVNGGDPGNALISTAPRTDINVLQMAATDGAVALNLGGTLSTGSIWQSAGASSLNLGGGVTVNGGTLNLGGNYSFTSVLTANSGGTAILTGNNIGRPGDVATRTVINAGGTLNNANVTIDVNNLDGATTGQTLGFAPGTLPFGNGVTVNVTGGNGYKLALGTFRNVTGTASNLTLNPTLNPTTGDLLLGGYSNQQANANPSTLNLAGASLANEVTGATTATVTDTSAGAGTSTLAISAQTPTVTVAARITDGPTRAVRVSVRNANAGNTLFTLNNPNTFSGSLLLANGTGSGTRLRITGVPVTVGTAGAIVSSPFGTGPITLGEAPTDKAGVLLDTAGNYTIANAIVFNTALGTDQPGIRLDTTGHTFSGTITANLSNALFGNVGSARLTGRVTGTNGLQLNASSVTITLANQTAAPNDYAGDTVIGAGATLVMGAANQIPNGALKGNLGTNGTLNLAGFDQTINGLSGAGTLSSSTGSPTLSLGGNNASATFTGNTGGTLSLAAGTDVIDQLFINGASQAPGKWGRPGSIAELGADFETSRISGDGLLSVTSSGGSPYSSWINTFFPGVTDPAIIGQTADPDKDGTDNLTEFAFDGHPASGSENGQIHVFAADSNFDGDTDNELILTAAIRNGTAGFTTPVNAVPNAITPGLPALSPG